MDGESFLLGAYNRTGESHTRELLFNLMKDDIEKVGADTLAAQRSDGAANIKLCRKRTAMDLESVEPIASPAQHRQQNSTSLSNKPRVEACCTDCCVLEHRK
jgi:hypothetical protein